MRQQTEAPAQPEASAPPEPPAQLLVPILDTGRVLGGVGRTTTYGLIASGKLEVVHIGRRVFTADSLDRFVAELRDAGAAPDPKPVG